MDIEALQLAGGIMSRLRCGRSSDSDGRDLFYAGPVKHARQHHSTALMEQERGAGQGAVGPVDQVDGGGSRLTGPTRSRSQDVPLEVGSRYGGRPTRLTELFRVDSVLSLHKGSSEFDVTTL